MNDVENLMSPMAAYAVTLLLLYSQEKSLRSKFNSPPSLEEKIFSKLDEPIEESLSSFTSFKLSENGVPTLNNRDAFLRLQENKSIPHSPLSEKFALLDKLICMPRLRNNTSTTEEHREETINFIRLLASQKIITIRDVAYNFDSPIVQQFAQKLNFLSPSAATYWWVHYALWGVSIMKLGTEKHWEAYVDKSDSLEITGSLMMTELHHGSNVQGIETQAIYDHKTREFILNTPHDGAMKDFIGGAVSNATHGVVFADLILNGKSYGIHAFVVQLRENGQNLSGITTIDCGRKLGLNGVDNGMVKFDHVRIPYDNLLDRYCEISPQGVYMPKEGNVNSYYLIYTLMAQFVRGRQIIAGSGISSLKMLCTLLYCYPPTSFPKLSFYKYLVSKLSKAYALEFAKPFFLGKEINNHINASLAKAVFSQMSMEECLETLQFYNSPHTETILKVVDDYRGDADATLIYEGVNVLLMQLGAAGILQQIKKCTTEWKQDLIRLKPPAVKKMWEFLYHKQEPIYLMKWEVISQAREIGNQIMKCKTNEEKIDKWMSSLQMQGIEMASIYTQVLIIEQFMKKAKELDQKYKTHLWSALCKIYTWETCSRCLKTKEPDLRNEYAIVQKEIPSLIVDLEIDLKWIDAIIPPPSFSIPYELITTANKTFENHKAAL